uniref:Transcription factor MYB35-like n=1 Tax=Ananas comosus var. bracteatus TaxID=296719 RepID=A0A6V7QFV1_ANACO|nr:unnamed protein product [Ananas comosus var. bracteatus]
MGRPPCCDKANVKKGPWTAEEDAKLLAYTSTHGTGNWTSVPKKQRCGKSCRLRYTNYLRPNLKHEGFTPAEEEHIITLHAMIGSRWSIIANQLPGRTDNDIKNYWNTKLSKKLRRCGIDPVTHRPISEVMHSINKLSNHPAPPSYSSSSSSGKSRSILTCDHDRISCFNRDLKSLFLSNPTPESSIPPSDTAPISMQPSATLPQVATETEWSDFLIESVIADHPEGLDFDHCGQLSNCGASSSTCTFQGPNCNIVRMEGLKREIGSTNTEEYALISEVNMYEKVNSVQGGSSQGSSSFIDAMLARDREMGSDQFPELPFDAYNSY